MTSRGHNNDSDPDDPQVQRDITESVKWALSNAVAGEDQDLVAAARAHYIGLRGEPDEAMELALRDSCRRQKQSSDFSSWDEIGSIPKTSPTRPQINRSDYSLQGQPVPSSPNQREFARALLDLALECLSEGKVKAGAHWMRLAAEKGSLKAAYNMGLMSVMGEIIEQNHSAAANWFQKAAEGGDADALFNLGMMNLQGTGMAQNPTEAYRLFHSAAEQGQARAMFWLGHMEEYGKHNLANAMQWYRLAAAKGNLEAKESLRRLAA